MSQYWKRLHELADEIGIQETLEILERVHGLSASECSRWRFKFCRRSDSQTYSVSYRAFDLMDAYAQFEADIDPDDVSWVEHSENIEKSHEH